MTSERDALLRAGQAFAVELAETPEMVEAAFRLRHQVYCRERGYEQGQGQREADHYDPHARHVILTQCGTGRVVGTVRIVAETGSAGPGLPMQRLLPAELLRALPLGTTGEVSRFAISKDLRDAACAGDALLRLGLMQGVVRLSGLMGLTHWCAVMEPALLRLLRASGIHFQPLGPAIEHRGLRQPCAAAIGPLLGRLRDERPHVWDYVTAAGALWRELETEAA
jgi:N-acyl-L-homoserine lactone synthetase